MNTTQLVSSLKASTPYLAAGALGAVLATSSSHAFFAGFYGLTPVITLAIARHRTRHEGLASVHSLDAWRIDSHSDTTLATGAAAHQVAL